MTPRRTGQIGFDPPYDLMFEGILAFGSLAETEKTIRRLEEYRQRFLAASDKKGVGYCRQMGLLGRNRAEMIARSRRVDAKKRAVKREAAHWFQVWLETPDLFADWLLLRRQADEFRALEFEGEV